MEEAETPREIGVASKLPPSPFLGETQISTPRCALKSQSCVTAYCNLSPNGRRYARIPRACIRKDVAEVLEGHSVKGVAAFKSPQNRYISTLQSGKTLAFLYNRVGVVYAEIPELNAD